MPSISWATSTGKTAATDFNKRRPRLSAVMISEVGPEILICWFSLILPISSCVLLFVFGRTATCTIQGNINWA